MLAGSCTILKAVPFTPFTLSFKATLTIIIYHIRPFKGARRLENYKDWPLIRKFTNSFKKESFAYAYHSEC